MLRLQKGALVNCTMGYDRLTMIKELVLIFQKKNLIKKVSDFSETDPIWLMIF